MDSARIHRFNDDKGEILIANRKKFVTGILASSIVILCSSMAQGEVEFSKVLIDEGIGVTGSDPDKLKNQITDPRAKAEWYSDETPRKKGTVKAFMIDATEVTNKQYKQVFPKHISPENLRDHPAVNVTWSKAHEYCNAVGGRLPTEAQWERAARGDDERIYPWGNEFTMGKAVYLGTIKEGSKLKIGSFTQEQSMSTKLGGTSPVGSLGKNSKNPFGLSDMAGNVWEWVDGWYDKDKKLRLLKGGSWLSPRSSMRISTRLGDKGDGVFNDYGFRCAYDHN